MSNVVGSVEFDVRLNFDSFNQELNRIKNQKLPCIPICIEPPKNLAQDIQKQVKQVSIQEKKEQTKSQKGEDQQTKENIEKLKEAIEKATVAFSSVRSVSVGTRSTQSSSGVRSEKGFTGEEGIILGIKSLRLAIEQTAVSIGEGIAVALESTESVLRELLPKDNIFKAAGRIVNQTAGNLISDSITGGGSGPNKIGVLIGKGAKFANNSPGSEKFNKDVDTVIPGFSKLLKYLESWDSSSNSVSKVGESERLDVAIIVSRSLTDAANRIVESLANTEKEINSLASALSSIPSLSLESLSPQRNNSQNPLLMAAQIAGANVAADEIKNIFNQIFGQFFSNAVNNTSGVIKNKIQEVFDGIFSKEAKEDNSVMGAIKNISDGLFAGISEESDDSSIVVHPNFSESYSLISYFQEITQVSDDLARNLLKLNESIIVVNGAKEVDSFGVATQVNYKSIMEEGEAFVEERQRHYNEIKNQSVDNIDICRIHELTDSGYNIKQGLRKAKKSDNSLPKEEQLLSSGSEFYQRYIEILRKIGQYDTLIVKKLRGIDKEIDQESSNKISQIESFTGQKILPQKKSGQNIAQGIAVGIEDGNDLLKESATAVFNIIDKTIRDKFDINSPSGWGKIVGENIIKGILEGLRTNDLEMTLKNSIGGIINSVDTGIGGETLNNTIRELLGISAEKILSENKESLDDLAKQVYEYVLSQDMDGVGSNFLRFFSGSFINNSQIMQGDGRVIGNKGGMGEVAASSAAGATENVLGTDSGLQSEIDNLLSRNKGVLKSVSTLMEVVSSLSSMDLGKEVSRDVIDVFRDILSGKTIKDSLSSSEILQEVADILKQAQPTNEDGVRENLKKHLLKSLEGANAISQSSLGDDHFISVWLKAFNDTFNRTEETEREDGLPSLENILSEERPVHVNRFDAWKEKAKEYLMKASRYAKAAAKTYFDQTEYQGHLFSLFLDAAETVNSEMQGIFNRDAFAKMPGIEAKIQQLESAVEELKRQKEVLEQEQKEIVDKINELDAARDQIIDFTAEKVKELTEQLNNYASDPMGNAASQLKSQIEEINQDESNKLQEILEERQQLIGGLSQVELNIANISSEESQQESRLKDQYKRKEKQENRQENPFNAEASYEETRRIENVFQERIQQFDNLFPGVKDFMVQGLAFLGSMETFQSMLGQAVDFVQESLEQVLGLLTNRGVLKGLTSTGQEYQDIQTFLDKQINTFSLDRATTESGFKGFYASAQGTSMEGDPTKKIFEGITQASRAYNLTRDQQEGTFLALTQMMSRGTISMEELRGQLSERLPGAMAIAARAMQMTQGELVELVSSGQLAANIFLPKFAQQLKNETANAAKSATGSLASIRQEYENIVFNFRVKVVETIEPGLKVLGRGFIFLINTAKKLAPLVAFMAGTIFLGSLEGIAGFLKIIAGHIVRIVGLAPLIAAGAAGIATPFVALLPLMAQVFEIKQWIGLFTLYIPIITTLIDGLNTKIELFGVTLYQSESDKALERITNSVQALKQSLNESTESANKLANSTANIKSVSPIDDKLRWDNKNSQEEILKGEMSAIKDFAYIGGAFAFDLVRSDYHAYDQEIRRVAQIKRGQDEALFRAGKADVPTQKILRSSPEFIDEWYYTSHGINNVEKPKSMRIYDRMTSLTTFGKFNDFNQLNRKLYKGFDKFLTNFLKTLGGLPAKVAARNAAMETGASIAGSAVNGIGIARTGSFSRGASRLVGNIPGINLLGRTAASVAKAFAPLGNAATKLSSKFLLAGASVVGPLADIALMAKSFAVAALPTLSAVLVGMVQFAVIIGLVAAAALAFNKTVSWMKGQGGKTITWTQVQEEWRINDNEKFNKQSNVTVDEILKTIGQYQGNVGILAEAENKNRQIQSLTVESGRLSDADPRKEIVKGEIARLNSTKALVDERINNLRSANLDAIKQLESQLETEKNPQLISSLQTQLNLVKKAQTMLEVAEAEASNMSAVKSFAVALRSLNNQFDSIAARFENYATNLDIDLSEKEIAEFSNPNARFLSSRLDVDRKTQEQEIAQQRLSEEQQSANLAKEQITSQAEFGNIERILRAEIGDLGIDASGAKTFDEMIQSLSSDQISALREKFTDEAIKQNLELVASYREKQSQILSGEQELAAKTIELKRAKEAAEIEIIENTYDQAANKLKLAATDEEVLIQRQLLNQEINEQESQLRMRQLEEVNAEKSIKLTENKIKQLQGSHKKGIISTDVYAEKMQGLEQQLADEQKQLIESKVATQEAVQQKVLDEMEKALQIATALMEQRQNQQTAIIKKAQLDRKMTESQANEALAKLASDRAKAEVTIKEKQLMELRKARTKGYITESEFASRERDLVTELSAAKTQALEEELALREAIKERILDELERANAMADAAINKKSSTAKQNIIQTQITEYQTKGDRVDALANQDQLKADRQALEKQQKLKVQAVEANKKMLNDNILSQEEYTDRQIAAEQELADIKIQILENTLAQQREAANSATAEIERAVSESQSKIDKLQSQRSVSIKEDQLKKGSSSRRLAATTAEIAQSESELIAVQERLKATEKQVREIQDAYNEGTISQQTYFEQMTAAEQSLAELKVQNFEQQISLQEQIANAALEELDRVIQKSEQALDKINTDSQIEIRQTELGQVQSLGEEKAGQNAEVSTNKLEKEQTLERIRQAQMELAEISRLRREEIIDAETANDHIAETETKLSQLKLDLIENEMNAKQLAADAAIAELEKVIQKSEQALDKINTDSQIEIRQTELGQIQSLGKEKAGQNAEVSTNKLEKEQTLERIRQAQMELAEISRLRREGIIDAETANDHIAETETKLSQLKLDLIENEMNARQLAADAAITELEKVIQKSEQALEKINIEGQTKIRQTELGQIQSLGEEKAGQNAEVSTNKLEKEQTLERIRQAQMELAEIKRLQEQGIVDAATASERITESEIKLSQLKLDLIENEMNARQLAADAAIAELERVQQAANSALEIAEAKQQLSIQQAALSGIDSQSIEALERQARSAELALEQQMQQERLNLAKQNQRELNRLKSTGLITEFDYQQRKIEAEKEMLEIEKGLTETRKQIKQAETDEIIRQIDLQIAAEQQRMNELSAAVDAEKALKDHKTQMLDFDKTLLDAQAGLQKARFDAEISQIQINLNETEDPIAKASLQEQLNAAKIAQLKEEYQIQLQQLEIETQRNQLAAEQMTMEAEINKMKAESAVLEAEMNLSKAKTTKDAEQIALAQSQLNIAQKQVAASDLGIQAAKRNMELQAKTSEIAKQTLDVQHQTAMAEAEAAARADQRAAAYQGMEQSANNAADAVSRASNAEANASARSGREYAQLTDRTERVDGIEAEFQQKCEGSGALWGPGVIERNRGKGISANPMSLRIPLPGGGTIVPSWEVDPKTVVDGARAMGGPVDVNKTYLVGEKGPELFIPSASGQIIPNGKPAPVSANATPGVGMVNNSNKELSIRLDALGDRIMRLANSPRNISVSTATPIADTLSLINKVSATKYPDV
jgi:tape measure domain-containing protein